MQTPTTQTPAAIARSMRRTARAGLLAGVAFSALLLGCFALVGRAQGPDAGPPAAPVAAPAPGTPGSPVAVNPPTAQVRITIVTVPSARKVFVNWGKKRLGVIAPRQPLVILRPRDSGPLDLIIRSEGYLPVQTRAFTFADSKVAVKLTPIDQKNTLLGYREEVPPPPAPDGGVPPPAPTAPTPPALPVPFIAPPAGAAPFVPDVRGR